MPAFNITLTPQQIQTISVALQELPYKHSAPILGEIQKQIDKQLAKAEADAALPPTEE